MPLIYELSILRGTVQFFIRTLARYSIETRSTRSTRSILAYFYFRQCSLYLLVIVLFLNLCIVHLFEYTFNVNGHRSISRIAENLQDNGISWPDAVEMENFKFPISIRAERAAAAAVYSAVHSEKMSA